jgi:S1-C subfamily serine protease
VAKRGEESEDYLNLGRARSADEFAIGEPSADLDEVRSEPPRAIYIVPLIICFVMLAAFTIGFFIFRAWDRTPRPDFDQQDIRVIDPSSSIDRPLKAEVAKPSPPPANTSTTNLPPVSVPPSSSASEPPLRTISAMLPELMPAIGMVVVRNPQGISSGSGFVISADGLFVTNHHVIKDYIDFAIKLNNSDKVYTAFVLVEDEVKDIAILRLKEQGPYPVLVLEEVAQPDLGEDVIVLGYPLGTKLGLDLTVSTGIISSFRNYPEISLIQTNAAINHGNSGGPMIYRRTGRVIGVVTAKARDSESIGFAINVKELKKLLNK